MKYKQCCLSRNLHVGVIETFEYQTTWIPAKYAKIGHILQLREDGVWIDGWHVDSVGATEEDVNLPDIHKAIRVHRKNTGDSLPKKKL